MPVLRASIGAKQKREEGGHRHAKYSGPERLAARYWRNISFEVFVEMFSQREQMANCLAGRICLRSVAVKRHASATQSEGRVRMFAPSP